MCIMITEAIYTAFKAQQEFMNTLDNTKDHTNHEQQPPSNKYMRDKTKTHGLDSLAS